VSSNPLHGLSANAENARQSISHATTTFRETGKTRMTPRHETAAASDESQGGCGLVAKGDHR